MSDHSEEFTNRDYTGTASLTVATHTHSAHTTLSILHLPYKLEPGILAEIEFFYSTGFAEIGADSEEFNGGNKNEDGIDDIGAVIGEEFYCAGEDILFEILINALLDREYITQSMCTCHASET